MYKFGTAFNCIDGRAQMPVIDWLKLGFNVQYVDLITEPGADAFLLNGTSNQIYSVREKIRLSLEKHQSEILAVAGHFDCLANPVSKEEHWRQIEETVNFIESWGVWVRIVGLWVNQWSSIDVICDTQKEEYKVSKSFL